MSNKVSASVSSVWRRMRPATQLTLLVVLLLMIFTGWTFWQQLQRSSARQVSVNIPPYGLVTVQLSTDPFPALTTGTVQMTLRLQSSGGRMTMVDQVSYTYGPVDGNEVFQGQIQAVGMETFQGPLRFTSVGEWWIKVRLENQGDSGEVTFTIPVEPAI